MIRPAREADCPAIARIWNHYIRDTAVTFTTVEKTAEGLWADIRARHRDGKPFIVWDSGGGVLGFATYAQFRGGPGYAFAMEHTIQLAPEAVGKGVGRALLDALEQHARAAGVHTMWSGVSGENPAGEAFHARMGYETVGRLPEVGRKFDRWMDLVLMVKRL